MNKAKEFLCYARKAARAKLGKVKAMALPAAALLTAAVVMSPVAYASGGDSGDAGMTKILGSIDTIVSLMGRVWDVMTSNPLLTLFLAVSLLLVGVKVFRRVKSAAK